MSFNKKGREEVIKAGINPTSVIIAKWIIPIKWQIKRPSIPEKTGSNLFFLFLKIPQNKVKNTKINIVAVPKSFCQNTITGNISPNIVIVQIIAGFFSCFSSILF